MELAADDVVPTALKTPKKKRDTEDNFAVDLVTALPAKLRKILRQGGSEFGLYFEPLSLEVTTKNYLYALLEYLKSGQRMIEAVCRSSELRVKHERNIGVFQAGRAPILLSEHRNKDQLSLPTALGVAT